MNPQEAHQIANSENLLVLESLKKWKNSFEKCNEGRLKDVFEYKMVECKFDICGRLSAQEKEIVRSQGRLQR